MAGCEHDRPQCAARWRDSLALRSGAEGRMVLLGWGEVGGCVRPGLRGGQRRILGAGGWGQGLSCETGLLDLENSLGFGGTVRGTSGPPPLPLHLLGLSGTVGREEEFARMGQRWRDVKEPFLAALGVGGVGGGPSTWLGSGGHANPDRSGRHALGPAPRPAILLPPPASPLRGRNSPPAAGPGEG